MLCSVSSCVRVGGWAALLIVCLPSHAGSLRFFGNGVGDIDRVKIRIDDPTNALPGPPADVGVGDFTIELWLRSEEDANPAGAVACGANYNWIYGNIVLDRDRFNQARAFGISLADGRVVFGTRTSADRTICGETDIRDGEWHHVAVQRRRSDGRLWLYVDGRLEATGDSPDDEDISYPDDGVPGPHCDGAPCTASDPFIVLGAEKHDAGPSFPSFDGWLEELRISSTLRYSGDFTPPSAPFVPDADTAALYHFDEPDGATVHDSAPGGSSPGEIRFGGTPAGPLRVDDSPFEASPSSGSVEFQAAGRTVAEGDGVVAVAVVRVGGGAGAASVTYETRDGTATAGADYETAAGTLLWDADETSARTIEIEIHDDSLEEPDETFDVVLTGVTGASLGTRLSLTVVVEDDDSASGGDPGDDDDDGEPGDPPGSPAPGGPPAAQSGGGGGGPIGMLGVLGLGALLLARRLTVRRAAPRFARVARADAPLWQG